MTEEKKSPTITFPQCEPMLVNLDTGEVTVRKSPDNVVNIEKAFLLRWAKRILKGQYKITYLEGKPDEPTDGK